MRRITLHKSGLALKIWYPVKLKKKSSPAYLALEFFGFKKYGGFNNAKKEAIKRRNWYEKKYNLKTDLWGAITGVSHRVRYLDDRNRPLCVWRASWRETVNGERVNRGKEFCYVYGDKTSRAQARAKAVRLREEMEKKHYPCSGTK